MKHQTFDIYIKPASDSATGPYWVTIYPVDDYEDMPVFQYIVPTAAEAWAAALGGIRTDDPASPPSRWFRNVPAMTVALGLIAAAKEIPLSWVFFEESRG